MARSRLVAQLKVRRGQALMGPRIIRSQRQGSFVVSQRLSWTPELL
ncbi:MAG TPA: hypothetical protein VFS62_16315 [Chloroflexota bacterium]|jgi:hypothetical protein|nr:hypothetical protein [Chloroflexota bacterium]